jgi:predicted PurR-regulated permease PerM
MIQETIQNLFITDRYTMICISAVLVIVIALVIGHSVRPVTIWLLALMRKNWLWAIIVIPILIVIWGFVWIVYVSVILMIISTIHSLLTKGRDRD